MSSNISSVSGKLADNDAIERYNDFEAAVNRSLYDLGGPFFTTDADPDKLWAAFIECLPVGRRQYYNCRCCKTFIQRYGGLVTIDPPGNQKPALWNLSDPPMFFSFAVDALYKLVKKAKVTGVFLSADKVLGTPSSKPIEKDYSKFGGGLEVKVWTHLSATNPNPWKISSIIADQKMAERLEEYKMLCHALSDYSSLATAEAVRALRSSTLYRSEKAIEIAEWFYKLHCLIRDNPMSVRRNLTWLVVANAPPGFCHIRSGIIGTLLDDIKAGVSFPDIAARWKAKLDPMQYQRPTALPKAGAIDQAEKLFATMGLERSLLRRYATINDVLSKLWTPRLVAATYQMTGPGVFEHLRERPAVSKQLELPAITMTWEKFYRTIIGPGNAYEMEIAISASPRHGFCGVLTAVDPTSPPLLQWDGIEGFNRNPVSAYYYHGGSPASRWGISFGWNKVTCVFANPAHWQLPNGFKNQQQRVHFAIAGCVDSHTPSLGLFPENIRSELHGVRAVIEAHSNSGHPIGNELANQVNGITLAENNPVTLRVRTAEGFASYLIDRLD